MKILIDTREQRPYIFDTPSQVGTLETSDYSLVGGEHLIGVERKTIDDLIGCLTNGRERFEKELFRGKALDQFHLVCECSLDDLASGRYRSKASPQSMVQSLITFSIRYNLQVWFAGSRAHGQRLTESLLQKFAREIEKKYKELEKGALSGLR